MQILQPRSLFYSFIWATSCKSQQEKITKQEKKNLGMDLYCIVLAYNSNEKPRGYLKFCAICP